MAKKTENAVYAPGELGRVRDRLGTLDDTEAKRVAQLLGGEVGTERNAEPDAKSKKPVRRETVELVVGGSGRRRRGRAIDMPGDEDEGSGKKFKLNEPFPGDDPSTPAKLGYFERVKIDQFSGQLAFEIKSSIQVLTSMLSFFREPIDYVNPRFVTKRMNEYYKKIEQLVTSSRNLFPQHNTKRNNQLKRASPFVYKVLDTFRTWNIESLAGNIAELQAHPRSTKVTDFVEILKAVYKPLYVLDDLNTESIKSAFKLIYKVLYIESPLDAKEKYQDIIRNIITALVTIRRDVQFGMYPLLMKLISDRFIPYERFFIERRRRFMAFLNVTEQEQLNAADLSIQQIENMDVEALKENQEEQVNTEGGENSGEDVPEEDLNDPKVIARKAKEEAEKAETKALDQGKSALEALFPKAGWDKLEEYPDLYPYFSDLYSIKRGYELIAPTDPLQQISILMHILEDIFYGMRYVKFGTIIGPDGNSVNVGEELGEIVNNWRRYIETSFAKDYLPRLAEYCRMLENSEEARTSAYARKNINELHWIKRLYFLPYYKFESLGPPPFHKQDVTAIYSQIRKMRKYLTSIAMGIEQGTQAGGAAVKAPCDGIYNPWEAYNFEIPNSVSKRLNMMLPSEKRINATLIFFSLSTIAVLDYIVNNENSWAYGGRPGPLFRSIRDEGITPLFGVDIKVDADKIFKDSLKKG
ncbi:MAG: hypothetical protein LBH44_11105 [Treponema sp.]|jgi:hypothetical protein|nr:hypothetical protein [Treponema sp.]